MRIGLIDESSQAHSRQSDSSEEVQATEKETVADLQSVWVYALVPFPMRLRKKPPCRRQGTLLTAKGQCPVHAEPLYVRSTVEETLNAILDAQADQLCSARRYEHTEARTD